MRLKQPQYLFPGHAQFGTDNLVLHAKGTRHLVNEFPGPLSIKSVISGEVGWVVDGRNIVVDTRSFLVLGDGQKYSMNVDAPRPVETCCAFFRRGFVEQVTQDMTSPLQAVDRRTPASGSASEIPLASPHGPQRPHSAILCGLSPSDVRNSYSPAALKKTFSFCLLS